MVSTVLSINIQQAGAAAPACSNPVAVNTPGSDLASRVAAAPVGTCFTFANGTYTFHDVVPKDDMVFLGASTAGVIIDGRGHENAFHGTADSVTIASMTFQDFNSSGGTKRQEQAPIRGTARLWASDAGQMATNWTIDGIVSQRNYAAGIFLGDHFTVRNSIFRNNGVAGLSGDSIVGGLIEANIVHGNGALQASGVYVNGGGMKFGQAGTPADPVVVKNNEVYDNPNIGIWCDIGCQGFHVIDNYIHDHVSRGVMYELSANLVVRGNRIEDSNTWTNHLGDFNAGAITVGESANALVENNHIENAQSGVVVRQTLRPAGGESFLFNYPFVNFVTSNVTVRNNVHVNVRQTGVSTGSTGNGLITNPGSISYSGNTYDNLSGMTFWWNNGQRLTAAQWQTAGRDTVANGSGPSTGDSDRGPDGSPVVPVQPAAPSTTVASAPTPVSPTSAGENPGELPLRINAGGPAMTDANGQHWLADRFYVGGNEASHAQGRSIANTDSDALYRNERWGATGYNIPLPAGEYVVRLHHAEVFVGCQSAECREFSVSVEGQTVVSDVDVYAEVGGYSALVVDTVSSVADGELTIRFSSSRQHAQVSGIEILQMSPTSSSPDNPITGTPGTPDPSGSNGTASPASSGNAPADVQPDPGVSGDARRPAQPEPSTGAAEDSSPANGVNDEPVGPANEGEPIESEAGSADDLVGDDLGGDAAGGVSSENAADGDSDSALIDDAVDTDPSDSRVERGETSGYGADQPAPGALALEIIGPSGAQDSPTPILPVLALLAALLGLVAVAARSVGQHVLTER